MAQRIGRPRGAAAERGRPVRDPQTRRVARAQRGDQGARRELVESHMGLVRALARRYREMGLPIEDLVQEGAIGVLEAIDHFDAAAGASFSTYAYWRARRMMTRALTDHGRLLRLPRTLLDHRRLIADAAANLGNEGRVPTAEALAEATHLPAADVVAALEAPTRLASLDAPFEDGSTLEAAVADPTSWDPSTAALAAVERANLLEALEHLTPRQRTVIEGRFGLSGEPKTLSKLGAELQLSPARVRAIEIGALSDLALALEPERGPP